MLSSEFEGNNGVLQGNVLSPMLCALLMDFTMNRVTQEGEEGLDWSNGRKLAFLEYADDAVLLCKTPEYLQNMLNRIHEISKEVGLEINKRKTEIMRTEYIQREELSVEGDNINEVESYKY